MRANRNLLGWGLFFILFGVVLLGVRQGWIPTEQAERAWQLWPILLVAGGLSLVLAGRPGAWVGGLLAAGCLGVMAGGIVSTGAALPFVGCGADDSGSPFERQSGELGPSASVGIDFHCGELSVLTAEGTTWDVTGQSADGEPPTIERSADRLGLEASSSGGLFDFSGKREQWVVTLPADPSIDLDVTLNAGSGSLTLAGAHLAATDVTVNAGSLRLDLRDAAAAGSLDGTVNAGSAVVWLPELAVEGDFTVNAGSLSICAPASIGLRLVTGDNPISSNDFEEQGLIRVDEAWETPDFATEEIKTVLEVTANAGSLSLNPRETCGG